jgi:hypothetical protein
LQRVLVAVAVLAALLVPAGGRAGATSIAPPNNPALDATVVAVIDSAFSPYHYDYLASEMPVDLPLDEAPDRWLPGFPSTKSFADYRALDLTLPDRKESPYAGLDTADEKDWASVRASTAEEINYYWMPGTKVIGALDFAGNQIHGDPGAHGTGTTSVSVGNMHGTCPECLLVFISYADAASGEAAISWAMRQPWIDVISNSYGFSATPVSRDRIYSGSDTQLQKKASTRGQTIFFSAGNGQANAFLVPNSTLLSSQEGPDWIVTVGAVSPGTHASYTGHGKPADIASLGSGYPSAYNATTVTGSGNFSGTSNATPVIAGTYARALYLARRDLYGPSRIQDGGTIATGARYRCGDGRPRCELGDGVLTATELRRRLFLGAKHTDAGLSPGGFGTLPVIGEEEFLSEGHGSYFARETGKVGAWLKEFDRILGPLEGRARELKRPDGEGDWMIVDSWCRQHLWGSWTGGYYLEGKTELPGAADASWPVRSTILDVCPHLQPTP